MSLIFEAFRQALGRQKNSDHDTEATILEARRFALWLDQQNQEEIKIVLAKPVRVKGQSGVYTEFTEVIIERGEKVQKKQGSSESSAIMYLTTQDQPVERIVLARLAVNNYFSEKPRGMVLDYVFELNPLVPSSEIKRVFKEIYSQTGVFEGKNSHIPNHLFW
ncbi:MAG: hypothetical protein N2654_05665 [Deltaproteobacteria bacterium]|nr:hypothetical protein [Deltaproteobacteria bacterium]